MRKSRPPLFKWRHFEPAVITCAVGWYLRFSLSYRNVEELLTERGLAADHTTIWRWVQCYAPELSKRCRRELKPTNGSWRVDETYIRVKGKWAYLYRAVDSTGATIDFLLSAHRDAAAAKRFFQKALHAPGHPRPRVINVDGNPSYPKVVQELKQGGETRPAKSLPHLPLFEQYRGAGPPSDQAADQRQSGIPVLSRCAADNRGLRSRAHDPERPSELVAEEGCGWARSVHQ